MVEWSPQPRWAKEMEARLMARSEDLFFAQRKEVAWMLNAAVVSIVAQLQVQPTPHEPGPATGLKMSLGAKNE